MCCLLVETTAIPVKFYRQGHSCNFIGPTDLLLLANLCPKTLAPATTKRNQKWCKELRGYPQKTKTSVQHCWQCSCSCTEANSSVSHTCYPNYCSDPLPKNLKASMQRTLLACFVVLFSLLQILGEKFFVWLSHPQKNQKNLFLHSCYPFLYSSVFFLSCLPINETTTLYYMLYISLNTCSGRAHQHIHTIQNVVGPSSTCDLPQHTPKKKLGTCKHWWWILGNVDGQFMSTIYNCIHHWYAPWTSMGHVHVGARPSYHPHTLSPTP